MRITVNVDGVSCTDDVEPRVLLVQHLRERLGKTGTVIGCDTGDCGSCTVHLDGCDVATVEGLAGDGRLHPVQQAFHDEHALRCGSCTPGTIVRALDLLAEDPDPDEHAVRHGPEGGLCRCTGHQNVVAAVLNAAHRMRPESGPGSERTNGPSPVGGVAATPLRAVAVERELVGKPATAATIAAAAEGAGAPSDGDAEHREHPARVLTRRAPR